MNVVIAFVSFGTMPPIDDGTLCSQIVSRRPDRLFHFEPGTPRFSLIDPHRSADISLTPYLNADFCRRFAAKSPQLRHHAVNTGVLM